MMRFVIGLLLSLVLCVPGYAAVNNTSGPWGIDVAGFKNLSTSLYSSATAGKTVVISKPMSTNNLTLPSNRHLKIVSGGSINPASGKIFNFNGQSPEAGRYRIFAGLGAISGLNKGYPEWFGVMPGSTTNDSTLMASSLAAIMSYGSLDFDAGIYSGYLSVRKNNITITGKGSGASVIKTPAGVNTNVLEIGETAHTGSPAPFDAVIVKGLTLDGNLSGTPTPTTDLTGWGLPVTNTKHLVLDDVKAVNCHNGGIGIFINSDYGRGSGLYVENCGTGFGAVTEPGFDINSSSYGIWDVITKDCKNGIRVLDNSVGNVVNGVIVNATDNGFLIGADQGNSNYGNQCNIMVAGGCQYIGASISGKTSGNTLNMNVYGVAGVGALLSTNTLSEKPIGNTINLTTKSSGAQGLLLNGDSNIVTHLSNTDGLSAGQGAWYAVEIIGSGNKVASTVVDSSTWKVRSVSVASGASNNEISYTRNDSMNGLLNDAGTNTKWGRIAGIGATIASASVLYFPYDGTSFHVSGTTGITSISPSAGTFQNGREVTLIFDGVLTVFDGNNLKLAGNLVTVPGTILRLLYDGTNWQEQGRSIN